MMTFKNKTFIGLAFVLSFAVVSTVFGEEYPNIGIVYGTKDNDSLTYDCNKKSEKIITCNFIHTSIRAELEKEKIASEIQKEMKYLLKRQLRNVKQKLKIAPVCQLLINQQWLHVFKIISKLEEKMDTWY